MSWTLARFARDDNFGYDAGDCLSFMTITRSELGAVAIVVLCIKIAIFALGVFAFGSFEGTGHNWFSVWYRWDSFAYGTIATHGYDPPLADENSLVGVKPDYHLFLSHFPPLYPLAAATLHVVTRIPIPYVQIGISWLAGIFAALALYALVRKFADANRALWAALFFVLFPTSYFTLSGYAESLFLLFAVMSLLSLLESRRPLAGIFAGLAVLTRITGIALFVPLFVDAAIAVKRRDFSKKHALMLLIPFCAAAGYLAINKLYFGDLLFFQKEYQTNPYSAKMFIAPFSEAIPWAWQGMSSIFRGEWSGLVMTTQGWNGIFTLLAGLAVVVGFMKRVMPLALSLYAGAAVLLFASFSWGISNTRYVLSAFPIFIVLAFIRPVWLRGIILAALAALLVGFTGIYVSGGWAF